MGYNYNNLSSTLQYYVPPTLVGDFDNFLNTEIPGAVMDFKVYHNWYECQQDEELIEVIRGEIYPDKSKSRYANTDNNLNFRTSVKSDIRKGDILIDTDNQVYLLDWDIPPQPNNKMSRALRCNATVTFTRYVLQKEYDDDGYRTEDQPKEIVIAEAIPCNGYRYDGRPEFSAISYTPGITPNALSILSVQYNEQTNNIRAGDNFIWGNDVYVVIDIGYAGMHFSGRNGVLSIQAKKEAGGDL